METIQESCALKATTAKA